MEACMPPVREIGQLQTLTDKTPEFSFFLEAVCPLRYFLRMFVQMCWLFFKGISIADVVF